MWKDTIELGNTTETVIYGEAISTFAYREVFANEKSIKQSEFYQAASVGLKPELMYEIRSFEFDNDEKVRIGGITGKEYSIVRTYKKGEIIELTLSAIVGTVV